MSWMRRLKRKIVILSILMAPGLALAADGLVDVQMVLDRPQVSEPLMLQLAFYPIEWGNDGQLRLKDATVRRMSYDPSVPSSTATFDIQLKPLTQYQVTIDIVDQVTGESVRERTYVFAGQLLQESDELKVRLVPGEKKPLNLSLSKVGRDSQRGNFIEVYPSSDAQGQYELAVYFGPDQVGSEVNPM